MFQLTSSIFDPQKTATNHKKHDWLRLPNLTVARATDILSSEYDVNVRAAKGQTALHVLLRYCSAPFELVDLVTLLLQHGADVNAVDDCRHTPLMWCVLHINHGLKFHVYQETVRPQPPEDWLTIQDTASKDEEQVRFDTRFQEQLYIVLQNLLEAGADPCIIPQAVPKHTLGVGTRIDAYGHRVLFTEGRWRQLSQHLFRMGVERTMYDAFNPMNNHFTTQAGINLIHLAAWRGDARCLAQLIHRACVQCADAISDIYERLESNGDLPSQSVRTSPKDVSDSGTNLGNKCVVSVSASCQSPTCPVRAVTTENCNALHYLYCYCNKPADLITCTRLLLRCGLSCHLEDKLENTPIFLLVRNALTKLSFIRHMANSFTEETISKSETEDNFHSVICECLHVMAEYGVDISRPNSDGVNPFRELFRYFSHDTVYGFDKEVQWNNYDIVPFTFDVKSLLRVARVLLDYQCDVDTRDSGDNGVIHHVIHCLDFLYLGPEKNSPADLREVMEFFLQNGADTRVYKPAYTTPITQMVTALCRMFSRQLDQLDAYLCIVDVYAAHRPHWASGLLLDTVLHPHMSAPVNARHRILCHLVSLGYTPHITRGVTIEGSMKDIQIFRLLYSYGDISIHKCIIKMHSDHMLDLLVDVPVKASIHAVDCHLCTMIEELREVRTLAFQCKKTIWRTMGNRFCDDVRNLPLPTRIQDYLQNIDCI